MTKHDERSPAIGTRIARAIFERRGNHSEVHLSEAELAAFLTFAIDHYAATGGKR